MQTEGVIRFNEAAEGDMMQAVYDIIEETMRNEGVEFNEADPVEHEDNELQYTLNLIRSHEEEQKTVQTVAIEIVMPEFLQYQKMQGLVSLSGELDQEDEEENRLQEVKTILEENPIVVEWFAE